MGFEPCKRRGSLWEDAKKLDHFIKNFPFNSTQKDERGFETAFASGMMALQGDFQNKIMSQQYPETTVQSVYCFGKKHRPDVTVEKDGIAIEIKYLKDTADNFKYSLGQTILYRIRYKFIFQVLILSKNNESLYEEIVNGEEKDLEDLLQYLSDELNIFTYIAPSFALKNNIRKVFYVNDLSDQT